MKTSLSLGRIKEQQICSILETLFNYPGSTRTELINRLELNRSSLTKNINNLIDLNWITSLDSSGKNLPLFINNEKLTSAGIELQPEHQVLTICNIEGKVLHHYEWKENISDINQFLNGVLAEYIKSLHIHLDTMGLALPGIFNGEKDALLSSQPFEIYEKYPLKTDVLEELVTTLFFDNDIRCLGWGITAFKKEKENFYLLNSNFEDFKEPREEYQRISIGSSIFINGKAFEGSHYCAGEFKSIREAGDGSEGQSAIAHTERVNIKSSPDLLIKFIDELALNTAFIINILDMEKIYIGGSLNHYKSMIERLFSIQILKNSLYPHIQNHTIIYLEPEEDTIARGAAGMAIKRILTGLEIMNYIK